MIKSILWFFGLAAVVYSALCGVLFLLQRALLYHPTAAVVSAEAQALWLENEDQRLKVWHVPASGERALLYFGGNAEDVALNLVQFKRLFPGISLFLLNYRGYGGSSGRPSEAGNQADALALYDFVKQNYTEIIVMGRSLGTGIAVQVASLRELTHLILVTPYDSMVHLASTYYPYIPVGLLLKDRYESITKAGTIEIPVLILVAQHDEVIPRAVSDPLVNAIKPGIAQLRIIENAGHNTIGTMVAYEAAIQQFLMLPSRPAE